MSAQAGMMIAPELPSRVREALALRSQGKSWRAVAEGLGLSDHRLIYAECRSHDAAMRGDERWKAITHQAMDIAQEAGAQLSEALLDRSIAPSQMPVVYGIAVDKVVGLRRAEQGSQSGDALGAVSQVLERLQSGGGSLEITIKAGHSTPERLVPVTLEAEAK